MDDHGKNSSLSEQVLLMPADETTNNRTFQTQFSRVARIPICFYQVVGPAPLENCIWDACGLVGKLEEPKTNFWGTLVCHPVFLQVVPPLTPQNLFSMDPLKAFPNVASRLKTLYCPSKFF